ncbi:protein hu-li tai shao-like isoform X2 [Argiope bruennichi]|uniref:Protein hu-li tai shao like protein n=1 Tax=Argiope bruennichi TaxID=94029 RepID=A0A8T0EV90_ARGBR|nr:protein hu-li tai shao-like isoform X1 [Argiope bruennichi]XP_055945810.1 protein hu-li tai shao-like isoform X1 [Argiope bruennichi]XP_055945811.1 protein hu-li tai shao-like isoform X2 [Argiope bruennichi]KAF8777949.1 Protein hu-li tai shao like protein [Argiope bruennichi]
MSNVENANEIIEETRNLELYDPDDPEYQKQLWRPPDIEQDVKEMERRKRVEIIMNSQVFREELERIIESQMSEGYVQADLAALQQVTELLLPHTSRTTTTSVRSGSCVIPINDIRGVDGLRYAKGEKILRSKLAAVYRLIDLYGWAESMFNNITVRVSQDQEHFLCHPYGLQYHEITASSLLKVDMQGNVIDPGTTNYTFNRSGFALHSAIHAARPDLKCIIQVHHPPCIAISATKCGLLPISPEAAILGEISYCDFHGTPTTQEEREQLSRTLGPVNKVLILRNRGMLICGESIEETLFMLHKAVAACETQVRLMPIGIDNIQLMSEAAIKHEREIVKSGGYPPEFKDDEPPGGDEDKERAEPKEKVKKWRIWDLEFEALMRMLDNAGFRTGYTFKQPMVRTDQVRVKNDVEVPPSASSYSQYYGEDKWLSPLKKLVEGRKTQDKLRWVNSPNVYQKVEVLETGTPDPKKITKWVQEGSPSHSTSVKIQSPHQFIPISNDIGEFKRKQKELKANRLKSKVTAGPQSNILEGVTWEEIRKMQDAVNASGDQVVLVGAASKGIIQREFQHNAMVYKSAYSKNPFDNISEQELEEYRKLVERKQRGELIEEDVPDDIKPLLMEPVAEPSKPEPPQPPTSKSPPSSPAKSKDSDNVAVQRALAEQGRTLPNSVESIEKKPNFFKRTFSERKPKKSAQVVNGQKMRSLESGDVSIASQSSKEGSPTKDLSESSSRKEKEKEKEKKKKGGIKAPSFLKSKKKHKKEKQEKGSTDI